MMNNEKKVKNYSSRNSTGWVLIEHTPKSQDYRITFNNTIKSKTTNN